MRFSDELPWFTDNGLDWENVTHIHRIFSYISHPNTYALSLAAIGVTVVVFLV
jgi:hypothetical protein